MISNKRIYVVFALFLLCSLGLIGRLFYLQVHEGERLASESLHNRIHELKIGQARGNILDRNGIFLTNMAKRNNIVVFPRQVTDKEKAAGQLAGYCHKKADYVFALLNGQSTSAFVLESGIDYITAQSIEDAHIPGVVIVQEKIRYGEKGLAAYLLGYINTVDNKGVSGIEYTYDDILSSSRAEYAAAIIDAGERLIPGLGYKYINANSGSAPVNIELTLDVEIQQIVEVVLDNQVIKGAVIVMKPATGEILAMASRPNFDANNLSLYLKKIEAPLMNRAICGFQPGSVFKLVVAAAALESKLVSTSDEFYDPGYIEVEGHKFQGWDYSQGGHGKISFIEAMAYSSNPVFIQVGLKLGGERVVSLARKFGFGHRTKLDIDGEAEGNLPLPEKLFSGDLANLSIGQGDLEATPLQIASMVATIVNDGAVVDPYVVSKLISTDGKVLKEFQASKGKAIISPRTAAQIRDMLTAVTRFGTGTSAYVDKFGCAS